MNPTNYLTATKLKGHDIPKDREGELLNLDPIGENPCVTTLFIFSPSLISRNYLIKSSVVSWGSYCWGVECGRTVSPCPHEHSTSRLTLVMTGKTTTPSLQGILHYSVCSMTAWDILPLSQAYSSHVETFCFLKHHLGFSIVVPHAWSKRVPIWPLTF